MTRKEWKKKEHSEEKSDSPVATKYEDIVYHLCNAYQSQRSARISVEIVGASHSEAAGAETPSSSESPCGPFHHMKQRGIKTLRKGRGYKMQHKGRFLHDKIRYCGVETESHQKQKNSLIFCRKWENWFKCFFTWKDFRCKIKLNHMNLQ